MEIVTVMVLLLAALGLLGVLTRRRKPTAEERHPIAVYTQHGWVVGGELRRNEHRR
jgi:hypothetical protein